MARDSTGLYEWECVILGDLQSTQSNSRYLREKGTWAVVFLAGVELGSTTNVSAESSTARSHRMRIMTPCS